MVGGRATALYADSLGISSINPNGSRNCDFATIGILVFSAMRSSDTKTSGLTRSIRSLTSLFNRQPKVRRPSRNPAAIKGRHFDRLFPNTVGLPNG